MRPLQISADFETALFEVCAYLPDEASSNTGHRETDQVGYKSRNPDYPANPVFKKNLNLENRLHIPRILYFQPT
jgi:hypothetical protein